MKHLTPTLVVVLLLAGTGGCDRPPADCPCAPAPEPEGVLAMVNGTPITARQVGFTLLGGHGGVPQTQKVTEEALDNLIDAELMYQKGVELGLDRDPRYQQAVTELELRLLALRRKEMTRQVYNSQIAARTNVTPEQARAYFDANRAAIDREYHLRAVQLQDEARIAAAKQRLAEDATFAQIAADLGDPAAVVADLGFLPWRQLPMEWVAAITPLEPGQRTGIVHGGKTGVRILELVERRAGKPSQFEDLTNVLSNRLRDQAVHAAHLDYLAALRDAARIERRPLPALP